jgi:hypothetical protein
MRLVLKFEEFADSLTAAAGLTINRSNELQITDILQAFQIC